MKLTIIGILFCLLACWAIFRMVKSLKNETVGYRSGLLWIAIWSGIAFFSIFPDYLNLAMRIGNMNNRMVFILTMAVFILFAVVFNQASYIDSMNRNVRKLVREIAILSHKLDEFKQDENNTK